MKSSFSNSGEGGWWWRKCHASPPPAGAHALHGVMYEKLTFAQIETALCCHKLDPVCTSGEFGGGGLGRP